MNAAISNEVAAPSDPVHTIGTLVRARGREWVVQPGSTPDFLLLQPLGGGPDDVTGVFLDEGITAATFAPPSVDDVGDAASTALLRTALRIGFTSSAGPFRSLARLSVSPRSYQYVPLMMALRQDTVRLLIADDVGIGKTVEAGLVATELLAQGTAQRLAVLCSPALAEQWQRELREKFGLDAAVVLTSTVKGLERGLMLNESIFDRYPYVIISSDFIKTDRRRHEFLLRCPELVIVDEAHNYVAGDGQGQGSRHQRHELLQGLAADPARHLILATATPHSGNEEAFTNLISLLDPDLRTADLSSSRGRERLARHMVQRRRADIRSYLDEDTPFPRDREIRDVPYELSLGYRDLFADVLDYARSQVQTGAGRTRGRIRWWSALALLRAMASSPPAAAATLRTRAQVADCEGDTPADLARIDDLGTAGVLDSGDAETLEGLDATPGSLIGHAKESDASQAGRERRQLEAFAKRAEALTGDEDRKLGALTRQLRALLRDGFAPIVFCRFIHTADYVAEHLRDALGTAKRPVHVESVTGRLPPAERADRVARLTEREGEHVLVATDCLSEGVNLQEAFSAVVHYDLAWNPTRHEQREGRVDRFGQRRDVVRAVTLYGSDNPIDPVVLEVLIRKHRAIAKATGVAVPVPGDGRGVIDAVAEQVLLRRAAVQETLDFETDPRTRELDEAWESAADQEKRSRTRYAQQGIKPDEVAEEVAAVRAALGAEDDVETFALQSLSALGSAPMPVPDGYQVVLDSLPLALSTSLPVGLRDPLTLRRDPPAGRGQASLVRTDPAVQALARYVLENALDPATPKQERPARRSGVLRTRAVSVRTTVLLVRLRFQLTIPDEGGLRQLVAEDARVLAFEGTPERADWLPDQRAEDLLAAAPSGNVVHGAAINALNKILAGLPSLTVHLDHVADEHAARLLNAHRRVRAGSKAARRGLTVTAQRPVDLLSVQVLLPEATG